MRIWLHLGLVLVSCGWVCFQKPALSPESEIERKAQELVDCYYGRGHAQVCVTLKQGRGQRTIRDQQFGEKGFVTKSQTRRETFNDKYLNETQSEKIELPQRLTITHQDHWLESTSVSVVVDRDPGADIQPLLWVGLGLDAKNGDQCRVVRSPR
ncbi:hypothetical protein ABS71_02510 [bacterium SCN 62-11]|nr:hypothetical protein [Candidatus Eremiobacteraeota bacterium]ODT77644.1 MAG: hypothetical protein ABS71_02510 [bacterium SCN 62-11]